MLTKNADPDKCKYSGYDIGFDTWSELLFIDGSIGKNAIIFGYDMSSSVHSDNKNKYILVTIEGPTQVLNDSKLTEEGISYPINFTQTNNLYTIKKICIKSTLSL